jgi:tyrosine-protein phosphatase 2/3
VIVMLTREVESALVKCGNYWAEGDYGSLHLKLLSTTDSPEQEERRKEREMSSGFFNLPQLLNTSEKQKENEEHTIRRVFELKNSKYPDAPSRIVTQLQYLDWPDLNVPKDPQGLLELMEEVNRVVDNARARGDMRWGEGPLEKTPSGTPPKESPSPTTDDVDPTTGIAKRAIGRAPVLLHCSAGVGRTGGFIAVDAVLDGIRREMRKRQDQESGRRSGSSSRSRSSLSTPEGMHDDTMDVDRTSTNPLVPMVQDTGTTLPVSAGANEVHVPIVSTSSDQAPMDVDGEVVTGTARQGALKPSLSLLEEMRSKHPEYVAAEAAHTYASHSPFPASQNVLEKAANIHSSLQAGNGQPDASSSAASSIRRSASASGQSVMSSSRTSTTSLTQAMKSVDPALGSERGSTHMASYGDSASTAQPSFSRSQGKLSSMNSWRTAVSNMQSDAPDHSNKSSAAHTSLQSPRSVQDTILASPRGVTFDYVEPRKLHGNVSPPVLSTYNEPIRRVIEDMREQRMSLCQSLRQYVFVHRAIIEGALRIVDQEKRRAERDITHQPFMAPSEDVEMPLQVSTAGSQSSPSPSPAAMQGITLLRKSARDSTNSPISPTPIRAPGLNRVEGLGFGSGLEEGGARSSPLSQVISVDAPMDAVSASGSFSPRAKRQASPAELILEDATGERRLTKRASIKRRAVTPPRDDGNVTSGGGMKIGSLVSSAPPSAAH